MPIVSTNAKEVFDLFPIALAAGRDLELTENDTEDTKSISMLDARDAFEKIKEAAVGGSVHEFEHQPGEAA